MPARRRSASSFGRACLTPRHVLSGSPPWRHLHLQGDGLAPLPLPVAHRRPPSLRSGELRTLTPGFLLLFTSYPIQGVQTIRFPDTGAYILIVLYSAYFVTSMWATFFLSWWGLEWCLPWGPISYATWIACMFSGSNAANLVGAAFFGCKYERSECSERVRVREMSVER